MVWLILPAGGVALTLGCRRHKDVGMMAAGGFGLAIVVATALVRHPWIGETGERVATLAGALILSTGHLRNYALCRREGCAP
jgi:hypothetical protein